MIITPESVRDCCLSHGGWQTRVMIARAHGKNKTTHAINTIRRAVELDMVTEVNGFDAYDRPCLVYRATLADEKETVA